MGYAFISYSAREQQNADSLRQLLHANQIDTWMAPHDIPEGNDYADVISGVIQNAACIVLLLTADTQDSALVDKEIERAIHYEKTIAPIQLDDVILNDSFSFYLCNQQIVTVPAIDASSPQMQRLLKHLALLCSDRPPETDATPDDLRDKRFFRQKVARFFIRLGIGLVLFAFFCAERYLTLVSQVTYQEMYDSRDIPLLTDIVRTFSLLAALFPAAVACFLYGRGLRDLQKDSWNPFRILTRRQLLPIACGCFGGCFEMSLLGQRTVNRLVRGLTTYREPTDGYLLPSWVQPLTWCAAVLFAITALILIWYGWRREKQQGFPLLRRLRSALRAFTATLKGGRK